MNLDRRAAAYLLVSLLTACSSDSSGPTTKDPGAEQDTKDVIFVPPVTDEALLRLWGVTAKNDARQTVTIDSPDLSVPLAKDSPATFKFHSASQLTRAPGSGPGKASPSPKWQRSFHEFLKFLAPERIAHAHGDPYTGTAYYLAFSDKGGKQLLQVFTPDTSFTPEALDFQHLAEAPQPLTLTITSAYFEDNSIHENDGPFVGGSFPFRIE